MLGLATTIRSRNHQSLLCGQKDFLRRYNKGQCPTVGGHHYDVGWHFIDRHCSDS